MLDDAFVFRTPPFWRREGPDITLCEFCSLLVIVKGRGISVIYLVGVLYEGKGFGRLIFCGSDDFMGGGGIVCLPFSLLETPTENTSEPLANRVRLTGNHSLLASGVSCFLAHQSPGNFSLG